jgi:hypothetical protein
VSYGEHIAPLRAAAGAGMRCVLVSATLPQHTFDELQDLFVDLGAAFGPGLHRTATGGGLCHVLQASRFAGQETMSCKMLGLQDKRACRPTTAACNLGQAAVVWL